MDELLLKERNIIDVTEWKKTYLAKKSIYCKDRFSIINHPLVISGEAYWIDENRICLKEK